MIARAAVAVALAAMACGGARPRGAPPPPPAPDAGPDAERDAGPDAAGDPATAILLAALGEQRDRACACPDRACAEDAEALAVQWGFDHPDVVRAAQPSAAEQVQAQALIEAAEACLDRWLAPHHPAHP